MRSRQRFLLDAVAAGATIFAGIAWWRGHSRFGAGFVTRVIDPWLIRRGIIGKAGGQIGLIEHVGRRSGTVRVAPVHPVAIEEGFKIIVPLGLESQWARNVTAAGHCRLERDGVVYELDRPELVAPAAVESVPRLVAPVMDWLGFRYLKLHRVSERPGVLATASS